MSWQDAGRTDFGELAVPRKRPLPSRGSCAHPFRALAEGILEWKSLFFSPRCSVLHNPAHGKHTWPLQKWAFLLCARCELMEVHTLSFPQLVSTVASADCPRPWEGHRAVHGLTSGSPSPLGSPLGLASLRGSRPLPRMCLTSL